MEKKKDARLLLEELTQRYAGILEGSREIRSKESWTEKAFGKMFSGQTTRSESYCMDLFESVEALCGELAKALETETPEDREAMALEALRLMLLSDLGDMEFSDRLIVVACEYAGRDMLPFLSREKLAELRDEYAKRAPKREMMPRQRELLKLMDSLLKQGRAR